MLTCEYILWNNCPNNCAFCHLKTLHQSTKEEQLLSIQLIEKDIQQQKDKYNILLVGGEIFVGLDNDLEEKLYQLYDIVFSSKLVNIIFINTNLIYKFSDFLFKVLDLAKYYNVLENIHFTTSDDVFGRFNDKKKIFFIENLQKIRKNYPNLNIIVNTILTKQFCDVVIKGDYNINDYCNKYKVKVNVLPYIDLTHNKDFIPQEKDLLKTLLILKEQNENWFRGYVDFFGRKHDDLLLQQYDLQTKKLKKVNCDLLQCGHSENFETCCIEKKCYSCLINNLL